MSKRLELIKQQSEHAAKMVQQLLANGELSGDPVIEPVLEEKIVETPSLPDEIQEQSSPVKSSKNTVSANDTEVELPSDESVVPEHQYKSAVKAMNEAQRQKSEYEKVLKDLEDQNRLYQEQIKLIELKRNVLPESSDVSTSYDLDEDEKELPKTVKIAERRASRIKDELGPKISSVEQELVNLRKEIESSKVEKMILERDAVIKQVHPDFDDVRFSDNFKTWIYGDAPSMYKGVYEGTIPFETSDVIKVFDDYKKSTGKTKQIAQSTTKKPGSAESQVKTSPSVNSEMSIQSEDTFTAKDLEALPKMIHKVKDPTQRAMLIQRAEAFIFKQQSKLKTN